MEIRYENVGDILYKVENYEFRYKGSHSADIELLCLDETEGEFAYQVEIAAHANVPERYREFSSAGVDFHKEIGVEKEEITFRSKEACLNHAIKAISVILELHSSKGDYL